MPELYGFVNEDLYADELNVGVNGYSQVSIYAKDGRSVLAFVTPLDAYRIGRMLVDEAQAAIENMQTAIDGDLHG